MKGKLCSNLFQHIKLNKEILLYDISYIYVYFQQFFLGVINKCCPSDETIEHSSVNNTLKAWYQDTEAVTEISLV